VFVQSMHIAGLWPSRRRLHEAIMAKWWKVGILLLATTLLPGQLRAQFKLFAKKTKDDPPPAFSNGPEQKDPQFCPDPRDVPAGGPAFCPTPEGPPQTPFLPCNEEDRNAFCDWHRPERSLCFWAKAEYLNWWMRDASVGSILATTSRTPNLANNFGALGQSGTEILFGPGEYDLGHLQGGRLTAGFTLPFFFPVEVSGFWLNKKNDLFSARSDGGPNSLLIARPVFLTQLHQQGAFNAGFPAGLAANIAVAGSFAIKTSTNLWGIDPSVFFHVGSSDVLSVDFFLGYKYAELREYWQFLGTDTALLGTFLPFNGGAVGPGGTTAAFDQFSTLNRFNGGQIGMRTGLSLWQFNLSADTKLAMGPTSQRVDVQGNSSATTTLTPLTVSNFAPGGILALPSNIGRTGGNRFSIIPELDLNLGVQITRQFRLFAGYDIMYWSSVVRPSDQLNNNIDSRQAPTDVAFAPGFRGTQPPSSFHRTDFWAQGFSVGFLFGW